MSGKTTQDNTKNGSAAKDTHASEETDSKRAERLETENANWRQENEDLQNQIADLTEKKDAEIERQHIEIQTSQALELKAWRKLDETRDAYYGLADEVRMIKDGTHPRFNPGSSPDEG